MPRFSKNVKTTSKREPWWAREQDLGTRAAENIDSVHLLFFVIEVFLSDTISRYWRLKNRLTKLLEV